MPQDEGHDDAQFPEPLGALGGVPASPRPADEPPGPAETDPYIHVHDRRAVGGESRRDRLVSWLRWAAAPLGFSLLLLGLTLFGLLTEPPTTDPGSAPAADASGTRSPAPPLVATTVPEAPTTTAAPTTEPPTTQPPTTQPPTTQPPTTQPPATQSPPRPSPGPVGTSAGRSTSPRFGPVCGYRPGQTVNIQINGQPAPPVTAGPDGCVVVNR